MAVLVEGVSVIVRRSAIDANYPGGWSGFVRDCPNRTLCADDHIARVGFMARSDSERFVDRLATRGLTATKNGQAHDVAVVDQRVGPITRAPWLEVGSVRVGGGNVQACRLAGDQTNVLITPDGWKFEESLSQNDGYMTPKQVAARMQFLRHEDGMDVFLDRETGELKYLARSGSSGTLADEEP